MNEIKSINGMKLIDDAARERVTVVENALEGKVGKNEVSTEVENYLVKNPISATVDETQLNNSVNNALKDVIDFSELESRRAAQVKEYAEKTNNSVVIKQKKINYKSDLNKTANRFSIFGNTAYIKDGVVKHTYTDGCEITSVGDFNGATSTYKININKNDTVLTIELDQPLRGLPNGIRDEITSEGKLIRRIGVYEVSDTAIDNMVYTALTGQDNKTYYLSKTTISNAKKDDTSNDFGQNVLCNKLNFVSTISNINAAAIADDGFYYQYTTQKFGLIALKTNFSDSDFKTYMKSKGLKIYYALANPVTSDIGVDISSLGEIVEGSNAIKFDNNIEGFFEYSIPANIQEVDYYFRNRNLCTFNGALHVEGDKYLVNQYNTPIVLRGASSHYLQADHSKPFSSPEGIKTLKLYGSNFFRIAMYILDSTWVENNGGAYLNNKETLFKRVCEITDACIKEGMYVLMDWHIVSTCSNPQTYQAEAIEFFERYATKYANVPNILYEICNEPSKCTWVDNVKPYAEAVIPAIRAISPNAVIIVGQPDLDKKPESVFSNKLTFDNIMYTIHSYAFNFDTDVNTGGVWKFRNKLINCICNGIPIFATENGFAKEDTSARTVYGQYAINVMDMFNSLNISMAVWGLSNNTDDNYNGYYLLKNTATAKGGWKYEDLADEGKLLFSNFESMLVDKDERAKEQTTYELKVVDSKLYLYVNGVAVSEVTIPTSGSDTPSIEYINVLNYANITEGYGLGTDSVCDGSPKVSNYSNLSEYIPVTPGEVYSLKRNDASTGIVFVGYYNSAKAYKSNVKTGGVVSGENKFVTDKIVIPDGVAYMRYVIAKTLEGAEQLMIVKGETYPDTYIEFNGGF